MKFTKKRIGYVPTVESFEETLVLGGIAQKDVKELVSCLLSKSGARIEARNLATPHNLLEATPIGDGSIVKRQIKITVEIKDLSNRRVKK